MNNHSPEIIKNDERLRMHWTDRLAVAARIAVVINAYVTVTGLNL